MKLEINQSTTMFPIIEQFLSLHRLSKLLKLSVFTICAGIFLLAPRFSHAETIHKVTATASSTCPGQQYSAIHAVDGSGLMPGKPDGLGHSVFGGGAMWISRRFDQEGGPDLDPWLLIDLGKIYQIKKFRVWNYNEPAGPGHGIKDVEISYSSTNPKGTDNILGKFVFAKGPEAGKEHLGEEFSESFQARYIKLKIKSNWDGDNVAYGLSEIRFDGKPAPPPDLKVRLLIGAAVPAGVPIFNHFAMLGAVTPANFLRSMLRQDMIRSFPSRNSATRGDFVPLMFISSKENATCCGNV